MDKIIIRNFLIGFGFGFGYTLTHCLIKYVRIGKYTSFSYKESIMCEPSSITRKFKPDNKFGIVAGLYYLCFYKNPNSDKDVSTCYYISGKETKDRLLNEKYYNASVSRY